MKNDHGMFALEDIEDRIGNDLSGANAQTMRAFYQAPTHQDLDPSDPLVKRFQKFLAQEEARAPKTQTQMARSSEAPPLAGIAAMGLRANEAEK